MTPGPLPYPDLDGVPALRDPHMNWLVRSALAILFPPTGDLPGVDNGGLDAFVAQFRRETPWLLWLGVLMGALVFHLTPVLTVHLPLPAFLLSPALADKHADRIAGSRWYLIRQAIFILKLPGGMAWGADPAVRERFALAPMERDPGSWRTS